LPINILCSEINEINENQRKVSILYNSIASANSKTKDF